MRVNNIKQISFQRKLTSNEISDYSNVLKEAKRLCGQDGKTIFIMPTACLPQSPEFNTGLGTLSGEYEQNYFQFLKNYFGIDVIEDLPSGQINPPEKAFYCSYDSSAFALGNHQINPELLTKEEFQNLLNQEDLKEVVSGNQSATKESIANYKNVMDNTGAHNQVLKKAFSKFQELDSKNPLKKKYLEFVDKNSYWLEFPREFEENHDFFKFKQFLADEHLKIAKQKLNDKGIKLCGDCQIGFSSDEVKHFSSAFPKTKSIGWALPALDFDSILDESSQAHQVLKNKIQLCAKRYDMIRFDVAWAYVQPRIVDLATGNVERKNLDDKLLKLIEKWVKEVKGEDFDLKNLIYEFDADADTFKIFNQDGSLIAPLKDRVKVYGSTYMNDNMGGWGYNKGFWERGWSKDEFVLGIGNHDPQPLKQIAKDIKDIDGQSHKQDAVKVLSKLFNISEEVLSHPVEFAKAKWAETMMGKNNMIFYMDAFGREERFDLQVLNTTLTPEKNYAYKVPSNYEDFYQKALKEGFAFNPMNALKRVFKAQGLDEMHNDLYKKLEMYDEILLAPEVQNLKKNKNPIVFGALAIAVVGGAIGIGIKKATNKKQIDTMITKNSIDEFVKSTKNNG